LRVTPEQELVLRDIRLDELPRIRAALREAALVPPNAGLHLTACPGSTVCSNAFTNSQALGEALSRKLLDLQKTGSGEPLRIRISGCTNGCALHAIAQIGLEGLAQRRDGALIPSYRLWLGGRGHQRQPRLGTDLGIIPARRTVDCVSDLMLLYQKECRASESFDQVLDRIGVELFAAVSRKHQEPGKLDELRMDLGDEAPYRAQATAPSTTC
jgi:sulfite reductase beta subunit-like hemoprotein